MRSVVMMMMFAMLLATVVPFAPLEPVDAPVEAAVHTPFMHAPVMATPVTVVVANAPAVPVPAIAEHETVGDVHVRAIEPDIIAITAVRRRIVVLEVPAARAVVVVAVVSRPA